MRTATEARGHDHACSISERNESLDRRITDLLRAAAAASNPEELHRQAVLIGLGLADTIARRYRNRGIELEDLIQVARLGLVKAVQGYRVESASSFVSYAAPTISGEIKRHFRDYGWLIRPPRSMQELRVDINECRTRLGQRLMRNPSDNEVALALGVPADRVREARLGELTYAPAASLEDAQPVSTESGYDRVVNRLATDAITAGLSDRERWIIKLRFDDELSQSQIATIIGVSQMQVSRLLSRILDKLRGSLHGIDLAS